MKNLLLIGQRSFLVDGSGNQMYPGGLERMSNTYLTILPDYYNVYYMFHNGRSNSVEEYKKEYERCIDIKEIPDDSNVLMDYLNDNKIDLVMISCWLSETMIRCIKDVLSKVDIPVLYYSHGTNMGAATDYASDIIKKDNFYISCCTKHEELANINAGIPKDRIYRIDNPVDLPPIENTDFKPTNEVVTVSRMQVGKGIPNSMEITTRIGKRLDIIGKKYRGYVVRQLAKMYPEDTYRCLGTMPRDELISKLKNYELFFLLPNEAEGMNLSVLEANALGIPVVVWNDWAFPDFLDHEFNIFLDHNLNTYIDEFMNNYYPKLNFYLDSNNRKELSSRTIERFGIPRYTKNLVDILEDIQK